jgi:hypothetical protein
VGGWVEKVSKVKKRGGGWGLGVASYHIFWNLKGYCIALAKPRRQALLTSFYNNMINHETKECFLKYLFHVHSMMLDILIQENEGIAKFFHINVKRLYEQSYGVKCNTCINLGYLHSP